MLDRSLYPRVTTVLHEGFKDGDLERWAIKMAMQKLLALWQEHMGTHDGALPDLEALCAEASGASKEIMRTAARRGTATHHLIEGKTREELQIQEEDWSSVESMYESFKLWAKERNFTPIANEVPVWSDKYGYKGTLDCIGYVDGRLELIDWKTSNAIQKGYRLQTTAYWYGLKESLPIVDKGKFWVGIPDVPGSENTLYFENNGLYEERADGFQKIEGIRIVRFGGRSNKDTQIKDLVKYEELIIDGQETIDEDFDAFLAAKKLHDWKLKRK